MIKIIIHIFPHEINEYNRVLNQIDTTHVRNIQIFSCLNLNKKIVLLEKEELNIIDEFKQINAKSKFSITEIIENSESFFGVNEHRRKCIMESNFDDFLIFLDTDLYFNKNLVNEMIINAYNLFLKKDYFILTPQLVRMWDTSWDVLVNEQYIDKPLGFYKTFDFRSIEKTNNTIKLKEIEKFKWAGGWFTGISAPLAKKIGIPKSFKGYGPDDTFMMHCCKYMKKRKIDVSQYVLDGCIVCENSNLKILNKKFIRKNNFRRECNYHLNSEYNCFKKKIDSYIYGNEDT